MAARAATVPILRRLSEEQWRRAGTHSESGSYSVEDWLRIYANHAHDHADQIHGFFNVLVARSSRAATADIAAALRKGLAA